MGRRDLVFDVTWFMACKTFLDSVPVTAYDSLLLLLVHAFLLVA